jgi:hypothetical protein
VSIYINWLELELKSELESELKSELKEWISSIKPSCIYLGKDINPSIFAGLGFRCDIDENYGQDMCYLSDYKIHYVNESSCEHNILEKYKLHLTGSNGGAYYKFVCESCNNEISLTDK